LGLLIKYKFPFALYCIIVVAEILINPCGDFPLNDDWSYAKSVMILHNEGRIDIGNWGAMTLVSHLFWGLAFTKVFGFSFFVLRFSTLISSLIGVSFLFRLVSQSSGSQFMGFVAALTLFFNPIYFNLSNTYMTDVNFNTLVILFICTAVSFYKSKKLWLFIPLLVLSISLVFLRQFGIIAPVSFMLGCLFIRERKWLFVVLAFLLSALVYLALKLYEADLREYLASWAPYKFSDQVNFTDPAFIDRFIYFTSSRYKTIVAHVLIFLFPFVAFSFKNIVRMSSKKFLLVGFVFSLVVTLFILKDAEFPFRNVFMNATLGPETFCESLANNVQHNQFPNFEIFNIVLKSVFFFGSLFALSLIILNLGTRIQFLFTKPISVFMAALFFSYVFMIFITESYFDRYHLPLISMAIIGYAFFAKDYSTSFRLEIIPLLICCYIGIAGTRDYFELNNKRWEAYHFLRNQNIDSEKINGGFEVNCWNDGKMNWWFDFFDPQKFSHVIQFNAPEGFIEYKEYPFQRYFPFKKDTIFIFAKVKDNESEIKPNVITE